MDNKDMKQIMEKAEVLIEALPYIQSLTAVSSWSNTAEVQWQIRSCSEMSSKM